MIALQSAVNDETRGLHKIIEGRADKEPNAEDKQAATTVAEKQKAVVAEANKALIYHYFGSKEKLFDAVWESVVQQVIESIPIDATDLAGYAKRLADTYRHRPDIRRLVSWQRLERGHDGQA